jgi:hypothetical protein
VTFASLAPALLLPGTLFFAVRYLVHKHNLLCLHVDKIAGAGDDDLFGPTETSERDSSRQTSDHEDSLLTLFQKRA